MKITGLMVNYYCLCQRKLWLCFHKINMENESELVNIGKVIDESTYEDEKHNFFIEDLANIDYLKNNTVYEIKKSDKMLESAIMQVKYYLYLLKERGLKNIKGKINVPLSKKSIDVFLDDEGIQEIEKCLAEIEKILNYKLPPQTLESKICKSCAYYELCFI
ncbi:MAG TPA: CRISPR-associated protein Cas4 [Clostridia bacterium]